MDITKIDNDLLNDLLQKASQSERHRYAYDLRNSEEDTSQRMLNVLEPGTKVAIHRHVKTSETAVCLEGYLDWVFYEEMPNVTEKGPVHDGGTAADESCFAEVDRVRICPREGKYGIQVPKGKWHSIEVYEPSTIFESKDGKYGE